MRRFGLCLVLLASLSGSPVRGDGPSAGRTHWAFLPPTRPPVPAVRRAEWVANPVDAFVLSRLEREGLSPAPAADPLTLLRRVTFDLTGLPPTPEEAEAFVKAFGAKPQAAYEELVERILASPHYGERWAQHWLDVVRYAESNGYEADAERPHAWRYRDWVVAALNNDLPYDEFLTEQIAGDYLARGKSDAERAPLLIATGFNRCGPVHLVGGNSDPDVTRQEVLTEMTTTIGAAVLGMTIQCARCHDHKFDPITQRDYYRLQAFFSGTQPKDSEIASPEEKDAHARRTEELKAQLEPLRRQVAELEAPYRAKITRAKKAKLEPQYLEALAVPADRRSKEQIRLAADAETLLKITWDEVVAVLSPADRERRAALRAQILALEAQTPLPPAHAWGVVDGPLTPPTYVLKRGDPKKKGDEVTPGFPSALGGPPADAKRPTRLDLAHWLTRPDHPLTARVIVNRLWQHHFGRGIVATPNDFGAHGEPPSHPELLDWLAAEFVESGWSLKYLHRLMVLSQTYRQASRVTPDDRTKRADPDNRLLWRMNRRRLEAEALRDAMLAAAGTLNRKVGGPMVRVPLEPEVYDLIFTEGEPDGLWQATPDPREHGRRSLYLFAKRNVRLPLLEAFDQPDTLTSCPVRAVSTFSPQALILFNGPFARRSSLEFAARLLQECGSDLGRLTEQAYRVALARPPRSDERAMAEEFLASQAELLRDRMRGRLPVASPEGVPEGTDPALAAALADFCLAVLNRNEFLYVP